ncbi:uncharacterized protein LOC119613378 [Lucilia sericata]|uniref:uncharacterized protein LOC119613378 n=1 Tax=Lucilia sericata TaxID=13632 RepID=UPI0018A841C1|nr:uncharacterized protein LOC119613378 [Lucilia sericata]
MSITCKFQLSRIANIYYGGEEVAGSLTICSVKQRQIEAIILEFYGQTTIQWWELDKTKENIMHNDFSTHEIVASDKTLYNQQQKHVCEQLKLDSLNCKQLLQPHVEYTYRFCFTIPQQAPATYRCRYGETEYGLRLQMQHAKKVNKEFHQRIVVKNKLDLTKDIKYQEPCVAYCHNEFGQINLQIPCSGFTPGQKVPYHIKYRTTQPDCKLLIQLNCFTTCHTPQSPSNKFKQIKQIINYEKHLSCECTSHVNIPLHSQISTIKNDPELVFSIEYTLEAILINGYKKALISLSVPVTIGTTPCYRFEGGLKSYMCFDNFGSSSAELFTTHDIGNLSYSAPDELFESLGIYP